VEDGLPRIEEENLSEERMIPDDEIWNLDDVDSEDEKTENSDESFEGLEALVKDKNDQDDKGQQAQDEEASDEDKEMVLEQIVAGVSDYQEVRYGSVRFDREL
jgi:hypothetical protein